MKLLTLDIEMMPNTVHVWDLRNIHYVAPSQVVEYAHFACAAYKFLNEPIQFVYADRYMPEHGDAEGLGMLWEAMNQADAIITFNGKKFDIPRLNSAFKEAGFQAPSPYHQIDLYLGLRKTFYWPSMKLDEISKILLGDHKKEHEGHNLWVRCMAGDPEAWKIFREYCEQDVLLTEKLYLDTRGWLPNHPNSLLFDGPEGAVGIACTTCGSSDYQRRGERVFSTGVYARYRCNNCGAWFKEQKRLYGSSVR